MKDWYAADFETNNINDEKAEVQAAGICTVSENPDFQSFTSFESFVKQVIKNVKHNSDIQFHNLKFDGSFFIDGLLLLGFKASSEKINKMPSKSFNPLIGGFGQQYQITLKINSKKVIYIKNSLNKLPFKLEEIAEKLALPIKKGKIDYLKYRKPGEVLNEEDEAYLKNDCEILALALNRLFRNNGLDRLTIGADCLQMFRDMSKDYYSFCFPNLDDKFQELNKYYRGGLCIVNKEKAKKGCSFDYNSMYPSQMHSNSGNLFPIGEPVKFEGAYIKDPQRPLYLQHIKANFEIKEGHIPFIQCKQFGYFKEENEFIKSSEGELVDLYFTSAEIGLFFDTYEVYELEFVDGFKFEGRCGLFDNYINKWFKIKKESNDNPVLRMLAKLFLNNLGGKFGTSTEGFRYNIKDFKENKAVMDQEKVSRKGVYLPVAIFMTSYARLELLNAINANLENFCYCDTDSLHLDCSPDEVKGLNIDPVELCNQKLEYTFEDGRYIKQKTYAEKINGKYVFKAAGMSEELKQNIDIEDFKKGFTTLNNEKYKGQTGLRGVRVPGGTVLKPVEFSIT